jgi:hypothetical protein
MAALVVRSISLDTKISARTGAILESTGAVVGSTFASFFCFLAGNYQGQ